VIIISTNEIKKIISKFKEDKKTMVIITIGIVGMLFVLLSGSETENEISAEINEPYIMSEKELGEELEAFIENIKGAGKAKVILSFETYDETVYAFDKDEKTDSKGTYDSASKYVIIDNGSTESGLKVKILSPKIRGVAILCNGGNIPTVKEQIILAVSALFNIGTNRISVAEMAD
jgi:stage III sporulation protein AG